MNASKNALERPVQRVSTGWGKLVGAVDPDPTRCLLLSRVADLADSAAWEEFDRIYRPMAERRLRQSGLCAADVADVAQDVFHAVMRAIPRFRYDRSKGRFRSWFASVVRSKLNSFRLKHRRQLEIAAAEEVLEHEARPVGSALESEEQTRSDRRLLLQLARRVRPEFQKSTWQAFWLTAMREVSPREVANRLGMSVGAVYIAKSRVVARIRHHAQEKQA